MATVAQPHRPHLALPHVDWHGVKPLPLLVTLAAGTVIWLIPPPQVAAETLPQGANLAKAWHLLAIFVATIVGSSSIRSRWAPSRCSASRLRR